MYTVERPAAMSTDDYDTGTDEELTITYAAAGRGLRHNISGVAWSYSAAPGAGAVLSILDGANVIFRLGLIAGGYGVVNFIPPKCGAPNTALTVTLSAGGVAVVGHLNVMGHWVEVA